MKIIIDEYEKKQCTYDGFTKSIKEVIEKLLKPKGIGVHSVTSRTKDKTSLETKLRKYEGEYLTLEDITDLSGIRIITYFEDDVDKVAKIVQKEFIIDKENSIDKRKLHDPDRFGYMSLHYVVSYNGSRLCLGEYETFKNLKAEIQIRSILQHAWAEIEHDLGYKSENAVPKDIRRDFSRLAGLLEIADSEFKRIRDFLSEYEKEVPATIRNSPNEVLIDKVSLRTYIYSSPTIKEINKEIKKNYKVDSSTLFIESFIKNLKYIGVKTISELDTLLKINKAIIPEFIKIFVNRALETGESFSIEVSLFYLFYIVMAEKGSSETIKYCETFRLNKLEDDVLDLPTKILNTYKEAKKRVQE